MASTILAAQYWGYLIKPDKSPTLVFEQLLLGVANYINRQIAPWDTQCLTPVKLAAFYRLLGGDYDPLFLDTSQASLSFIYQSLGCFHTLQPEKDPYTPPTTPALTPQGFVRWQTIQLLLDPEEHVPFLQEAVKRFDLINPIDNVPFPSILPKEALPCKPDLEMTEWHDTVSEKLMLEAQASQARNMPPRPTMALSDGDYSSSRASSFDSHSIDSHSIIDTTGYFSHTRTHPTFRPTPFVNVSPSSAPEQPPPAYDAPWSPERRRSSLPENHFDSYHTSWPPDRPMPGSFAPRSHHHPYPHHHHHHRPQNHARAPSALSTTSTSTTDSSITTSSASLSPVRYHAQLHAAPKSPQDRRHSTHFHPQRPISRSGGYFAQQRQPPGPARANTRGLNVRWQDMDEVLESPPPRSRPVSTGPASRDGRGMMTDNERGDERGRGSRSVGPVTGVGGRRYAAEGMAWR